MALVSAAPNQVLSIGGGSGAAFDSDVVGLSVPLIRPALAAIDSTAGTTITLAIQASLDNVNWFAAPYATAAAPQTPAVATVTITTTTITIVHLLEFAYLFLRFRFTANTGMTINSIKVLV